MTYATILLISVRYRGIQEIRKSIEALPYDHLIIIRYSGRISKYFTDCNYYNLIIISDYYLARYISGILSKIGRSAMVFFGKDF